MLFRSLFVLLFYHFGHLCCLSFFDWHILVTPSLSLHSSYKHKNMHQIINADPRHRCLVAVVICKFERENVKIRGHICGSSWYQDLLLLILVAYNVHCDVVFCFRNIDLFSCYWLVILSLSFSCRSIRFRL